MFSPKLEKFEDFKGLIDEYLAGELSQEDTLTLLEGLRVQYAEQEKDVLSGFNRAPQLKLEYSDIVKKLTEACKLFESARAGVEEAVAEERHDDFESHYEDFREGNRLLLEANVDLEEILEQNQMRRQEL